MPIKKILLSFFAFASVLISSTLVYAEFSSSIQKRIEIFKVSKTKIKELKNSIRSEDTATAYDAVKFHIIWSEKMKDYFPKGSHASATNGSDASIEIWGNFNEFEKYTSL